MSNASFLLTAFLRPDNQMPKVHPGTLQGSGRGHLHLGSNSASAASLAKLVRGLGEDRRWKLVFMHPGNPMLHPSRSVSATTMIGSKTSGAITPLPPCCDTRNA